MANNLYTVRFYGLDSSGQTMFDKGGYYTDAEKAKRELVSYTEDIPNTLNFYLYPDRVSLSVHLIIRELVDGEYKYRKSAIYAACENGEIKTYTENPIFKEL